MMKKYMKNTMGSKIRIKTFVYICVLILSNFWQPFYGAIIFLTYIGTKAKMHTLFFATSCLAYFFSLVGFDLNRSSHNFAIENPSIHLPLDNNS